MLLTLALTTFVVGASYAFIRYNDVPSKFFAYKKNVMEFDYAGYCRKLKYLFQYMWPQDNRVRLKVVACFVLMMIERILNVLVPLLGKMIIDQQPQNSHFLWDLASMTFGYLCLQGNGYVVQVFSGLQRTIYNSVRNFMSSQIKVDIYKHLLRMPYSWYMKSKDEDPVSIFYASVGRFEHFPEYILFNLTGSIADAFLGFAVFASTFDFQLTVMMSAIAIAYFVFNRYIYFWGQVSFEAKDDEDEDTDEELNSYVLCQDALENFETVKYFCAEDMEQERFERAIKQEDTGYLKTQGFDEFRSTFIQLFNDSLMMLGAFLMAYQRSYDENSTLTTGDYVLFTSFFHKFTQPFYDIDNFINQLRASAGEADAVIELLAQPEENFGSKLKNVKIYGGLKVDNVCFSYPEGEEVLHKVSFEVPEGKTVALVGPTGSGKSTLIRLLYRFLEPTEGAIRINGTDIRDHDIYDYRRQIGVVPQECILFDRSIKYNLSYANLEATEDEIEHATKAAQIDKMIEKKPKKLKTNVGYRGANLSGGEKQRMAIARTILKKTKYLLMDEATSSLDTVTERQIQKAFADLAKDRTCVIVAHRLSTIVHADNIVVLQDGRVLEQGNHKQLLENNELYAKMWNLQLGGDFDL
ncbi:unnamed protein product [Bursaphelenchus xylophilus]|uniref:(pine wood nematode) hypothetical protein n=1 Tax=Bursaphelenchus xylophilus TaxID=6326 RepID=A0A7I8XIU4_BURXY|nr:unnamed protein product [Bursaphelenchus xylophilus]CAG9125344.1 unnamed protein product [Bursaphelenchus xylophilus]